MEVTWGFYLAFGLQKLQLCHDICGRKDLVPMTGKEMECLEKEKSLVCKPAHDISKPNDIFICTYPKTGTTLMQYICHLLRTRGLRNYLKINDNNI
jgi:hypothetical protein